MTRLRGQKHKTRVIFMIETARNYHHDSRFLWKILEIYHLEVLFQHHNSRFYLAGIQRRSRLFMMWSGFISIISSIILLNIFISSKMANYSLFWAVMNYRSKLVKAVPCLLVKQGLVSNQFGQNRIENI